MKKFITDVKQFFIWIGFMVFVFIVTGIDKVRKVIKR